MSNFIIERNILGDGNLAEEQLRQIVARSAAVVASLDELYTWHLGYVAGDRFYCIHEADSAAAVYRYVENGGFPADKLTKIESFIGPAVSSGISDP